MQNNKNDHNQNRQNTKNTVGTYKTLLTSFLNHLATLNYSSGTVQSTKNCLKDYLHHLSQSGLPLYLTNTIAVKGFFAHLFTRNNKTRGGGLSPNYLQKYRHSLKLFYEYLNDTNTLEKQFNVDFPPIPKQKRKPPKTLTQKQVENLFDACENNLLGQRNKTMLTLYYSCGLRKQEGILLDVDDIDLEKGQILIRKTKTGRQRYVPLSNKTIKTLESYLFNTREMLLPSDKVETAVLLSEKGERLSPSTPPKVLEKLAQKAKIPSSEKPTIHGLRHSIATHLLQAGMPLGSISNFLGHQSLDSTQIYTAVAAERTRQ